MVANMNVKEEVEVVVKLYFDGYTVEQAIEIVENKVTAETLKKILKNYEREVKLS